MSRTKRHSNKSSFERKARRAVSIHRRASRQMASLADMYIELPISNKLQNI